MSTTDIINSLASQTQAAANSAKSSATDLGIEDFLALMTAQLKNQDPLKPLDSTEFVAQLAQFGTVSGVQAMQDSLSTLSDSLRSAQALQGTALVGHDVLTAADSITIGAGESVQGAIEVPDGASSVQIAVTDSSGQLVRTLTLPTSAGTTDFTWDGLDDQGAAAAAGTYTFTSIANVGGSSESIETQLAARVSSVTIDAAGTGLTLNTASLGSVALSDVRRVM